MKTSDLTFMPKFFDTYIRLVPSDIHLIDALERSKDDFGKIKTSLIKYQDYRYEPGKWTPKDIIQHIIDNEWVQGYRSLVYARGDKPVLPGYEENLYAANTNANDRAMEDLLEDFQTIRKASIMLYKNLSEEQLHRSGVSFNVEVTPLALGFQIIGHVTHHINVLKERYFVKA